MERVKGYMEFSLFKKIIDDASNIGVKRVHLYLHGEPLLHPKIVEMISYIKLKGLAPTLKTNGMLATRENSKGILNTRVNSGDHIVVSILDFSKEIHEKIMKDVIHDKVSENLINFLNLRKKYKVNGPVVEIVFHGMPENAHEKFLFLKKWRGHVDHVRIVERISKCYANYKRENIPILIRIKTCKLLWERMSIYWNGDVMCVIKI